MQAYGRAEPQPPTAKTGRWQESLSAGWFEYLWHYSCCGITAVYVFPLKCAYEIKVTLRNKSRNEMRGKQNVRAAAKQSALMPTASWNLTMIPLRKLPKKTMVQQTVTGVSQNRPHRDKREEEVDVELLST